MALDHNGKFMFWHVVEGVAVPEYNDDKVNANPSEYYGSIEGAILHGGVQATAFSRKTEMTYDAALWFKTGAMVEAGSVTTTKITAP